MVRSQANGLRYFASPLNRRWEEGIRLTLDLENICFIDCEGLHTTEIYDVDGVKYLLLGGGGAEQDPILPGRTKVKVPNDYPPDLYWKGEAPKEEYNYVLVNVEPGQRTKFTVNRFRPWSAKSFESVELFGDSK